MKKLLTFLFIIPQVFFLNAQSLVVTGATTVPSADPCFQSHSSLTVKNISSNTLNVFCEKVIIDTTLGTDNFFCWGGNCYGSTTHLSTDFNELLPGEGDNVDFGGYYDAYCDLASATVQYCFFPDIDPLDRTCITIIYNGGLTPVIENNSDFTMDEFYPNPAQEYATIRYKSGDNSHLKIIDILGNKVKDIHLSNSGKEEVYVGDLSKGIYFGNLVHNNKVIAIKKLIVK